MSDVPVQIGSCEIQREIGRGGMGVVYVARDTELDREVAIKALPVELAADESRRKRFERESRLLASLHHSNIAAVYGLEQVDGRPFLLMEYVPGKTLRELLRKGSVPIEEAMRIAIHIARALQAAHDKGIVHRDLKPSNVKFAADGTVKVLDFGLAKDLDPMALGTTEVEDERTTETGVVVGTPGYMSPEQMRGQAVDQRADIWAFGSVLYEMLTGRTAFSSESGTDAIASVLREDPDWDALPGRTPASVRWLLRRCLAKDPDRRLHHIADARIELEEALGDPVASARTAGTTTARAPATALIWTLAGLVLLGAVLAVWGWVRPPLPAPGLPTRVDLALPPDQLLVDAALSPDGRTLAYAARPAGSDGPSHLYLRSLDSWDLREVPRSTNAESLFFQPDGEWLGFFNGESLQKVPVSGGQPQPVCDVRLPATGAAWIPDRGGGETIVFGQLAKPLWQVPAQGGTAEPITELRAGEGGHAGPVYAGRGTVLFSIRDGGGFRLHALDLDSHERREVDLGNADPRQARYLPTGHLLYAQSDGLWVAGFDIETLRATTPPVCKVPEAGSHLDRSPIFSVSRSGTLVYVPGSGRIVRSHLVQVDLEQQDTLLLDQEAHYLWPNISPDGRKLAYQTQDGDLWVLDLERRTRLRLTEKEGSTNIWPVWTPDSSALTFGSTRNGPINLFRKPADGSAAAEAILAGPENRGPISWSSDGTLSFVELRTATGLDLWTWKGGEPDPFSTTRSNESMLTFSPDGRWMAWVSDATGHNEIYAAPRSGSAPGAPVSTDGGTEPVWSEPATLYFRNGSQLLSLSLSDADAVRDAGEPEILFEAREVYPSGNHFPNYDVFPDGQHFVFVKPVAEMSPTLRIVFDWSTEVRERLPWESRLP